MMTWQLAAMILATSGATVLLALSGLGLLTPAPAMAAGGDSPDAIFLFDDRRLMDASEAGSGLLAQMGGSAPEWSRLMAWLEPRFPGVEGELGRLGVGERRRIAARSGPPLELEADWRGGALRLAIFDPRQDGTRLDRLSQRAQDEELALLRAAAQGAPVLIWRQERDGTVAWANRAYLAAAGLADEEGVWPLPRLFDTGPALALASSAGASGESRRLALGGEGDAPVRWFDCHGTPQDGGELFFARPVTRLVQTETTLREFIQTLGKTFADLPIGLAIFDRSRKLQLFNPALVDLTGIGAEVLSARPTLFAFLDRLRDARTMPERKDYATWRQQMIDLEKAAASGQYEETWNLPTGQTYRVTGRPHPEGAVALLIEDISAEVSLTRRFRAELELGQEVLDTLPDAVAVFSPAGNLLMSNIAYARLWDIDATALCQPGAGEAVNRWQAMTQPSPHWAEARSYLLTLGERAEWERRLQHEDGRALVVRLAPLPGGATSVCFRETPAKPPAVLEIAAVSA